MPESEVIAVNKIKIKSDGSITRIFMDSKEIHDVTEYKLTQLAGEVPILHLNIMASHIEVEGNSVTCLENKIGKTTEKAKPTKPLENNTEWMDKISASVANALNKEEKRRF